MFDSCTCKHVLDDIIFIPTPVVLQGMGYADGEGLGRNSEGIRAPIAVVVKKNKQGIRPAGPPSPPPQQPPQPQFGGPPGAPGDGVSGDKRREKARRKRRKLEKQMGLAPLALTGLGLQPGKDSIFPHTENPIRKPLNEKRTREVKSRKAGGARAPGADWARPAARLGPVDLHCPKP